jgi:tetratricopeptide (TPR) repeat protein
MTESQLRQQIENLTLLRKNKKYNYAECANLYIDLYQYFYDSCTQEDKHSALSFCIEASRIIPHSSLYLELVFVYAHWARTILDDLSQTDPDLESSQVMQFQFKINNYEAIVSRQLGKNDHWQNLLDENLRLYRSHPTYFENPHTVFWGLAIWYSIQGDHEIGLQHATSALGLSQNKKNQITSKKLMFFNIYQLGRIDMVKDYLDFFIETKDFDTLVDIIWFIFKHGVYIEIHALIAKAILSLPNFSGLTKTSKKIKRISIDIYFHLACEPESEKIAELSTTLFSFLRDVQSSFSTPEFLSSYIEDHLLLFDKLILHAHAVHKYPLLLESLYNAFLTLGVSSSERDSHSQQSAPSGQAPFHSGLTLPREGVARLVMYGMSENVFSLSLHADGTHYESLIPYDQTRWKNWPVLFASPSPSIFTQILQKLSILFFQHILEPVIHLSIPPILSSIPWTSLALACKKQIMIKPVVIQSHVSPISSSSQLICFSSEDSGLDFSRNEIEEIKKIYGANCIHSDTKDLETFYHLLRSAKVFHFSGHGFGGIKTNGGLLLRGKPENLDSISISYSQIRGMNLTGMHLAFVNCCYSANAKFYPGQLSTDVATAFLDAGVQFVIASMRAIDDIMSYNFSKVFYQHFKSSQSAIDAFYSAISQTPDSDRFYTLFSSI